VQAAAAATSAGGISMIILAFAQGVRQMDARIKRPIDASSFLVVDRS